MQRSISGNKFVMQKMSKYPVRPVPHEDESLDGYIYRFYATNRHRIPKEITPYLNGITRGYVNHYVEKIIDFTDISFIKPTITRFIHQNILIKKRAPSLEFRMPGYKAYCPKCISESAYHKHLWNFPLMKACPIHGCNLINACQHCGHSLTFSQLVHQWTCKCGHLISNMQTTKASEQDLELSSYIAGVPPHPATPIGTPAEEAIHELMEWAMTIRRIIKGTHTRTPYWIKQEIQNEMRLFFNNTLILISTSENLPADIVLEKRSRIYIQNNMTKNQRASCRVSGKWERMLLSSTSRIGPRFLRLIKAMEKSNHNLFIDLTTSTKIQLIYFATRRLITRYQGIFQEIQTSIHSTIKNYFLSDQHLPMIFNPSYSEDKLKDHYKRLVFWWSTAQLELLFSTQEKIKKINTAKIILDTSKNPLPATSYINLANKLASLAWHPNARPITCNLLSQWALPEQMKGNLRITTLLLYCRLMKPSIQEEIIRLINEETAALQ